MSIIEFLETNTIELLAQFVIAVCGCMLLAPIGMRFVGKDKPLLGALLGISLVGTLTLIVASFCAVLAKYVVWAGYLAGGSITLCNILQEKYSVKNIVKSVVPFAIVAMVFFVKYLVYLIPQNGYVLFNCHLTYYADIPIEIFKADYFSRLRITDCYPYEWSQYHLFAGSMAAVPFCLFFEKNLITFTIAKYILVALSVNAVYEYCCNMLDSGRAKLLMMFEIIVWLVCAKSLVDQSLFTNHYISVFYFMLLCLMIERKDYSAGMIVAMFLAVSASRTVLLGGILCLYCLVMSVKEVDIKKWVKISKDGLVICFINGVGVLVTVFCGEKITNTFRITSIVNVTYLGGWNRCIPLGSFVNGLFGYADYRYVLEISILFLYGFLLWRRRNQINEVFSRYNVGKILVLLVFLQLLYHGCACIYWQERTWSFYIAYDVYFVYMYILPIFVTWLYLDKANKIPYTVFIIIIIVQGVIFNDSVSIFSYSLIYVTLFMCLGQEMLELIKYSSITNRKILDGLVIAFCCLMFFVSDQNFYWGFKWDHYYDEVPLAKISIQKEPYEYYCENDATLAKLHAIKGNRVHYNVEIDRVNNLTIKNTTMAGEFIGRLPE